MSEYPSAAEVIAGVIKRAEDDAYLHGAWNSRPDVEPQAVLDALREAGWAVVPLPELQADFREHTALAEAAHARNDIAEANYQYGRADTLTKILAAAAAASQDGEK